MVDQDLRYRLATLIVEALEVGSGKHEYDIIDEIFNSFDLDFNDLNTQFSPNMRDRAKSLRQASANLLAEAAPSAAAMLNEVVRCGGRFIAMLNEVYARLSRHTVTTTGTSETFRLERGGLDEEHLVINPAFLEKLRHYERSLRLMEIGKIDEAAIESFTVWDNGELYGRWPLKPVNGNWGDRLADDVLNLAWITTTVSQRASIDATWVPIVSAVDAARSAVERLVTSAERLVRRHVTHLDTVSASDSENAAALMISGYDELPQWRQESIQQDMAVELERYRAERILARTATPGNVTGINEMSAVGLRDDLTPVVVPATDHWPGTGVSSLAYFIAMWRLGFWSPKRRAEMERELLVDPWQLESWLGRIAASCNDAATWLTNDVFVSTGSAEVEELLELIKEFLNLPLWRQRHLLYEVWILCAILDACEQASWVVDLCGLTQPNGIWILSVGPADDPVAILRRSTDSAISLEVWREPKRITNDGERTLTLTPDVTISTPSPYSRDLLIVEAKDRQKMSVGGDYIEASAASSKSAKRTALGVAWRYATGLRPLATWVCNHCDFRQSTDPVTNHGDLWTHVHVAAQFRPGNVPVAFSDSVRAALAPPIDIRSARPTGPSVDFGLILVVDITGSMSGHLRNAFAILREELAREPFEEFRAVLYSDHGANEPFLVRKLGPYGSLPHLIDAMATLPSGDGGDFDEALEDAMLRCREILEDIGPQSILVLTDAPPHTVEHCPYRIDFEAEVRAILGAGCRLWVANNWLAPQDRTWDAFQDIPGFQSRSLSEFVAWKTQASG